MLYVFKTRGIFDVPNPGANARLRRQLNRQLTPDEVITIPTETYGYVSVVRPTLPDYMVMFHYYKRESVFYYKEELAIIEYILSKEKINYNIYDVNSNELIPLPAIVLPIDIALTEIKENETIF